MTLLFLCLKYWLTLFNPAVVAQILNPVAALAIPIGIPVKEVKAEIEIHRVIVELKSESVQCNLEL